MNREMIKETLLSFRPNSPDSSDPKVKEALDQMATDPELRLWFEDHCAWQSLMRERLRQIPIPPDLQQRILDELARPRRVIWWRRPVFQAWAAAAAILLALGTVYLVSRPDQSQTFAGYRNRMVRSVQRLYMMDMETNNLGQIRSYLASHQAHSDYTLPPALETLPAVGCTVVPWRDRTVSLICFKSGNRADLYLFIINRADLPDPPETDRPQFVRIGKLSSASWSLGNASYILAARGDEALVRKYLE